MVEDVTIEMMSSDFIVWRCLHDGPLQRDNIDAYKPHPAVPWDRIRPRNLQILSDLTDAYGSCAVLARDGDKVVGTLRFHPKAVCQMESMGMLCLQQEFPAGPREDLSRLRLPPLAGIEDKTLSVHCLMIASIGGGNTPYHRKGISTRMARHLVEWARLRGWQSIEAHAYCDLPSFYSITGQAGRTFWENLGFREVGRAAAFDNEDHPFVRQVVAEAEAAGLDGSLAKCKWTMRLELA